MKGTVSIDSKGEITSTLPLGDEKTNELGIVISSILQDINSYMKSSQGSQMGELRKTTLRLGNSHEVRIVVGAEQIKAKIIELGGAEGKLAE